MATLLQLENEIRAMEGHLNSDDADLQTSIRSAINQALNRAVEEQPWWWNATETTVTANSDGNLVMPEDTSFVLGVYDGDDQPMHPRDRKQQMDYKDRITSRQRQKTYAHAGYDSATGFPLLKLHPSGDGDYGVYYCPAATTLDEDADVIPGPRSLYYYLLWFARAVRLHGNEERQNLREEAMKFANEELAKMKGRNRGFLASIRKHLSIG